MLIVKYKPFMLGVIMLNVVLPSVVAPEKPDRREFKNEIELRMNFPLFESTLYKLSQWHNWMLSSEF